MGRVKVRWGYQLDYRASLVQPDAVFDTFKEVLAGVLSVTKEEQHFRMMKGERTLRGFVYHAYAVCVNSKGAVWQCPDDEITTLLEEHIKD